MKTKINYSGLIKVARLRRLIRGACFFAKLYGLGFSATVKPFFRSNFGRHQVNAIFGGCLILLCLVVLTSQWALPTLAFLTSLLIWYLYHHILGLQRGRLKLTEPPVRYSGDSWNFWHVLGFSVKTVQCFIEPALCCIVGYVVLRFDLLLGFWLLVAGASLYIRGNRLKIRSCILAAFDDKFKADSPIYFPSEPAGDPTPVFDKPDASNVPSAQLYLWMTNPDGKNFPTTHKNNKHK